MIVIEKGPPPNMARRSQQDQKGLVSLWHQMSPQSLGRALGSSPQMAEIESLTSPDEKVRASLKLVF